MTALRRQTTAAPLPPVYRPLWGKRVVITRAAHQAGDFDRLLRRRGAIPLHYPCLSIQPLEDNTLLDTALRQAAAGQFDWLVVTSANTVTILAGRLAVLRLTANALMLQIAAVGAKTAQAVETQLGRKAYILSEEYQAAGLAAGLRPYSGLRVLLPQAEIASAGLTETLQRQGAVVERIAVYQTVTGGHGGVDLPQLLQRRAVDVLTFASPSAVHGFVQRLRIEMQTEAVDLPDLTGLTVAVVGPTTRQAALNAGLSVDVMPDVYTLENLISALERTFDTH